MSATSATTPLYDWHRAHGARMIDFSGWTMPVQYSSIVDEHRATRTAVGLFDISHMGRLRFDGPAAARFLDRMLTREVVGLGLGRIRYSLVVNEAGGILDDVLVYRLVEPTGQEYHLLVVNAGNRLKIVDWLQRQLPSEPGVQMVDQTLATSMIAVQGPQAIATTQALLDVDLASLKYYSGVAARLHGQPVLVSRTGYTGEDGYELILSAESAVTAWEGLLGAVRGVGGLPVGLGARDTLRLEAALPLYGHELTEQLDPFSAGLDFAVKLEGRDFIGRDALVLRRQQPLTQVRIGLQLDGRRVPREHYPIFGDGHPVGVVSSGTFSPTLERPIAMAYVQPDMAEPNRELQVEIRSERYPARVVPLPFYRRSKNC